MLITQFEKEDHLPLTVRVITVCCNTITLELIKAWQVNSAITHNLAPKIWFQNSIASVDWFRLLSWTRSSTFDRHAPWIWLQTAVTQNIASVSSVLLSTHKKQTIWKFNECFLLTKTETMTQVIFQLLDPTPIYTLCTFSFSLGLQWVIFEKEYSNCKQKRNLPHFH